MAIARRSGECDRFNSRIFWKKAKISRRYPAKLTHPTAPLQSNCDGGEFALPATPATKMEIKLKISALRRFLLALGEKSWVAACATSQHRQKGDVILKSKDILKCFHQ
jgi:hypothetical protein